MDALAALRFASPLLALLALLPAAVVIYQYVYPRQRGTIPSTGLEYLLDRQCIGGDRPKNSKAAIHLAIVAALALLWAGPEYRSHRPLFESDAPVRLKTYVIALDISPSMNLPSDVTGYGEEDLKAGEEGVTRFEMAQAAMVDFLDRFRGQRFGLVLFSTEPLLARWPTTDTRENFAEVLESIRRGAATQLGAFSSLTNIDKGLAMARRAAGGREAAIILISDAEDHLENIGAAVSELRDAGLRLYVIGVGISEEVIAALSEQFADDPGFRIFRAASAEEMEEAYEIVGDVEESPLVAGEEQVYRADLTWAFALFAALLSTLLILLGELRYHTTYATDREAGGSGGRRP